MNEISVFIPKESSSYPFTCYAQGSFIRMEDYETEYKISFCEKSVLILFYHFDFHRRLYITLPENSLSEVENKKFWNITENRQILAELRGRNFDRFKRSVDFINDFTKGDCYNFPASFWSQITMLCEQNRHCKKNLNFLCESYYAFFKEEL